MSTFESRMADRERQVTALSATIVRADGERPDPHWRCCKVPHSLNHPHEVWSEALQEHLDACSKSGRRVAISKDPGTADGVELADVLLVGQGAEAADLGCKSVMDWLHGYTSAQAANQR